MIVLDLHSFFSFVPVTFTLWLMSFWFMVVLVDTLSLHSMDVSAFSDGKFGLLIGPFHLLLVTFLVLFIFLIVASLVPLVGTSDLISRVNFLVPFVFMISNAFSCFRSIGPTALVVVSSVLYSI